MKATNFSEPRALSEARLDVETSPSGALRLLFVTWATLGFSTYARELRDYSTTRTDIETVHVILGLSGLRRAVATGRVRGRGVLHPAVRQRRAIRASHVASLRRLLETGAFRAVHFTPSSLGDLVLRAAPRIPYSIGLDTTAVLRGGSEARNGWIRQSDKELYRHASFLAPMSQQASDSLENDFDVQPDRLMLTPPAIDVGLFDNDAPPAIPPRLLFIGNDWRRKGGPSLLRWHQQHMADRCELHVVGDVPTPTRSTKGIVFHGSVPRTVIAHELLPSATALVLPSRLEMTPWVIVEAAAAKIPVIASDVGAVRETVRDGETGFLLRRNHEEEDFVRAASMLLSDASMGERMGLAAQVNVRTANSRDVVFGRLFERLMSL